MLVKIFIAVLVMSLLGAKFLFQHQELMAAKEKNSALIQNQAQRDALITQLQENAVNNQKRLAQLHSEQRRLTQTLTQREAFIENLQHDDPHLQVWSDTALPDTIIRVRHRPAAASARDYYPELPEP